MTMQDWPMMDLAVEVKEMLRPGCQRIEIAGSLRRGKLDPKDIEILAIPTIEEEYQPGLFGDPGIVTGRRSGIDDSLPLLFEAGWSFDAETKRNGEKYKRLVYLPTGSILDLFITSPDEWGVNFAYRTGPAEYSHLLARRCLTLGFHTVDARLHRHKKDKGDEGCRKGSQCPLVVATPEEVDFFEALKMGYIDPPLRNPANFATAVRDWKAKR